MNHGYSNPAPGSPDQTLAMKSPTACSLIPHLLEIDPFQEFEFSFPCQEMWWDDLDTTTSDYFSCDEDYSAALSDVSYDEIFTAPGPAMIDTSFPSKFYSLSPNPIPEPDPDFNEKDVLIQKIISTLSHVAPTSVYKRRKSAKKRRKHRRKRKLMLVDNIEPELRAIWHNFVDVLPVKDPVHPPPISTLPTINLATVNKQMLRRLPDVVYLPVLSCSPDPAFYERNLPCRVLDNHFVSAFGRDSPFGKLPAIYTDLGPVPPPADSCYGYVWTTDGWRVKAERPPGHVPDPGGGQRRGGVGGGHVGGAERRGGWKNKYLCER